MGVKVTPPDFIVNRFQLSFSTSSAVTAVFSYSDGGTPTAALNILEKYPTSS